MWQNVPPGYLQTTNFLTTLFTYSFTHSVLSDHCFVLRHKKSRNFKIKIIHPVLFSIQWWRIETSGRKTHQKIVIIHFNGNYLGFFSSLWYPPSSPPPPPFSIRRFPWKFMKPWFSFVQKKSLTLGRRLEGRLLSSLRLQEEVIQITLTWHVGLIGTSLRVVHIGLDCR